MTSINKRNWMGPDGKEKTAYVVRYKDEDGIRRLKTFARQKEAVAYRTEVDNDLRTGVHVADRAAITFKEACKIYIDHITLKNKQTGKPVQTTIDQAEWISRKHLIPKFGSKKVNSLEGEEIQNWVNEMATKTNWSTMKSYLFVLTSVLTHGVRKNLLKRNVVRDYRIQVPGAKAKIVVPSLKEVSELLKELEHRSRAEHVATFLARRCFISLALYGGMRLGEICGLQWDCVNFDKEKIIIKRSFSARNGLKEPKTTAGIREIPMVRPIREALIEYMGIKTNSTEGFCFTTGTGEPYNIGKFHRVLWRPLMCRAGLGLVKPGQKGLQAKFHFHALRHANVSLLIAEGIPSINIAKHIGHAKITTTLDTYGHLFPEDQRVHAGLKGISDKMGTTWGRHKPVSA